MSCIATNNSDNNCNTMDNINIEVSSAMMNSIEKTPISSNIGLDQIPGIWMMTSQSSITTIDRMSCAMNNNSFVPKYQSDDTKITCESDNTSNVHNLPCANTYDNIKLNKNNHQGSGIEPIIISNQENVTIPTVNAPIKSTEANKLLTTEMSRMKELSNNALKIEKYKLLNTELLSMKELLDNALEMEQLLANPSTTDTTHSTCTIPGNGTLLSVMISSMKQIMTNPPS